MSLQGDLLEQAKHLALRETKRPRQASLRRSVSTSYYALFHLLTAEATRLVAPNISGSIFHHLQRSFDHSEMKRICQYFRGPLLVKPASLAGLTLPPDLIFVAESFIDLQKARHLADYDLGSMWNRLIALRHVRNAESAFAAWERVRKTPEANVFMLAMLMWKKFEVDR